MGGRVRWEGRGALIARLVVTAVMTIALMTFAWPVARLDRGPARRRDARARRARRARGLGGQIGRS